VKQVFTFGFLKIRKSYSKTAYKVRHRNLKLASVLSAPHLTALLRKKVWAMLPIIVWLAF